MKDWFVFIVPLMLVLLISCGEEISSEPDDRNAQSLSTPAYNVAFLIMDGVYNTELTAPFDIFHHTRFRQGIKPMNVFLVANKYDAVTSFEGIKFIPDYNYLRDSVPKVDILVVPSAEHHLDSDLEDQEMLQFVKRVAEEADFVTSHCDGAFVLAKAGLLDGFSSTTFPSDIDRYREMFPKLDVYEDVLFVHDGKFITSVGGARSFEAALYLTELLYGTEVARSLAKGLVIDWNQDSIKIAIIESKK